MVQNGENGQTHFNIIILLICLKGTKNLADLPPCNLFIVLTLGDINNIIISNK